VARAHSREDALRIQLSLSTTTIPQPYELLIGPSHTLTKKEPINRNKSNKMAAQAPQLRSLYRRFLREMPTRIPSILANPSPVQKHIRTDIATQSSDNSPSLAHQLQTKSAESRLQEAEQILQFVQQQRLYSTLVERYNPGMNMDEEERVRLTARRVGMELPVEHIKEEKE
jgi:ATP synthase assembly factor FMC1